MKRIITLIIMLLTIYTLVGCNENKIVLNDYISKYEKCDTFNFFYNDQTVDVIIRKISINDFINQEFYDEFNKIALVKKSEHINTNELAPIHSLEFIDNSNNSLYIHFTFLDDNLSTAVVVTNGEAFYMQESTSLFNKIIYYLTLKTEIDNSIPSEEESLTIIKNSLNQIVFPYISCILKVYINDLKNSTKKEIKNNDYIGIVFRILNGKICIEEHENYVFEYEITLDYPEKDIVTWHYILKVDKINNVIMIMNNDIMIGVVKISCDDINRLCD